MNPIGSRALRWLTPLALVLATTACTDHSPFAVIEARISTVRISPRTPTLPAIGDSLQLTLSATTTSGSTTECEAAWSSSDAEKVKVNNKGKIVGKAAGVALIVATCGGVADSTEVRVGAEVHSVAISRTSVSLQAGALDSLWAVAHDSNNDPIPGATFQWSSSDSGVAAVDSTGRLTGVSVGTATITAAAGGKSAAAQVSVTGATVSPPPPTGSGDLVVYPNAQVEFILGPQLRAGSAANPWPWFDQNQVARAMVHANAFPADPGIAYVTGTIAINHTVSRKKVIGTGTRFTQELKPGQWIYIYNPDPARDTYSGMGVASIESDTELTLTGDWWEGTSFTGGRIAYRTGAVNWDSYLNAQYYDLGLALYLTYYRTGDIQYLTAARKVVDSWWKSPVAMDGKMSVTHAGSPRSVSLGGLMLRALDGRPDMWPWITGYTRHQLNEWVLKRATNSGLYFGVRDGGYMLLYGAWLGQVHPDAAVRQEFRSNTLRGARDYYARLQHNDGGWYWEDSGNTWEQPFMVGLLLDGLVAVHRQSGDPAVRNAILRSVEHQWQFYRRTQTVPERPEARWRAVPYFIRPDGTVSGETNLAGGWDTNTIREGRQRNTMLLHAFGYAYQLTGDSRYREWGDELFASTFGKGSGPGADAYYSLADFREKEFNQAYRSAGRYLAWRSGSQ